MHLGLDLLFLVPGETGGRETYVRELLPRLRAARSDLRVTAFINRETAGVGAGFWTRHADRTVLLSRTWARREATWALGEVAGILRAAAQAKVEVLHSPANFGPWSGPFARVLTVLDLGHRQVPDATRTAMRWGTEAMMRPAIARAHRIVTPSAATAAALAELGVGAYRIDVAPLGVTPPPDPRPDRAAARAVLSVGDRSVALAVSTHLPHKNLAGLLEGLARIPDTERPILAVAGHGTDAPELAGRAAALGLSGDVRLLGRQPPADLERLYAAADLLVTTTRQEGFGLPVVEAMRRGLAVAASDLPVLREVAGKDGAMWLDPNRADSIARAIRRLVTHRELRDRLAAAGPRRAAGFTWERSAAITLRAYERALATRGRALVNRLGCPP